MTLASPKGPPSIATAAFPRSLSSMAVSVGGLAIFLVLASLLLVSSPLGSTVHSYFYGIDSTKRLDSQSGSNFDVPISVNNSTVNFIGKNSLPSEPNLQASTADSRQEEEAKVRGSSIASNATGNVVPNSYGNADKGLDESSPAAATSDSKSEVKSTISAVPSNAAKTGSDDLGTLFGIVDEHMIYIIVVLFIYLFC